MRSPSREAIDLESSEARRIIDGRVLKATDSMPVGGLEAHNRRVCLNMVIAEFMA